MNLSDYLAEERGRSADLARAINENPAYLSQMAAGKRPVHPALVPQIVAYSKGRVQPWDLRPDDWHLIWPELKRAKGAPQLKAA